MTRLLLSGTIKSAAVRRRRNSDGRLFAVAKVADRDRLETRVWTVFINEEPMIERFEALRVGEPVALCGAFTAALGADGGGIEWRITAEALLDTRKPKKSATAKRREERIRSEEADGAPAETLDDGRLFDDPLPW